jgi:iron complex outermembrane receptor protein
VNKGIELGVAGRATTHLSFYGGLTVLDATINETGTPALNGKSPAGVPERAFSLYADYRLPGMEQWAVNAGVVSIGKRPVFTDNSGTVPAYTLLNLGARYEFKTGTGRTRLLVNLDNATDEFYWDTVDSFGTLTIGVPRTLRFAAQFDF